MNRRVAISVVLLLGIFLSAPYYPALSTLMSGQQQCVTEKVILIRQYLADEPDFPGLQGCHNCLHLYVQEEKTGMKKTLFFALEHELHPDWQKGDVLEVKWCNYDGEWRIRGVWKVGK